MQVYLVTGGYGDEYLTSTEILTSGASVWTETGPLPSPRAYSRGVSINNRILITGTGKAKKDKTSCSIVSGGFNKTSPLGEIMQFDPDSENWSMVGVMKNAREYHGISVVNATIVEEYCNID